MLAPVVAQPSLPLDNPSAVESGEAELAVVRERLEREDLTVLVYRFEGDRHCRAQRFAAYQAALGSRFIARTLPDSAAHRRQGDRGLQARHVDDAVVHRAPLAMPRDTVMQPPEKCVCLRETDPLRPITHAAFPIVDQRKRPFIE